MWIDPMLEGPMVQRQHEFHNTYVGHVAPMLQCQFPKKKCKSDEKITMPQS